MLRMFLGGARLNFNGKVFHVPSRHGHWSTCLEEKLRDSKLNVQTTFISSLATSYTSRRGSGGCFRH